MGNSFLNIIQIIVAVTLVVVIIVQVRGQGGGLFGSAEGSFRTRRGLEKTLFQFTIGLVGLFIVTSLVSVRQGGRPYSGAEHRMPTSPPIITLTSDFGLRDAYVATVKGVILSVCRDAAITDVTHQVPAQDVAHGAFVIAEAYDSYPNDAVHVCVVDPGVGTGRRAVALVTPRGLFVAPDNGLLTRVIAKLLAQASVDLSTQDPGFLPVPPGCKAYVLQEPKYWRSTVSNTFHGRDVFAPVAAHLANGVKPANFGAETDVLVALPEQLPEISFNSVKGTVVYVDSFGNLITNIAGEAIGQGDAVVEVGGRKIEGPVRTFADTDGLMALVGSFGFLEIALRDGSAAAELGVAVGETVKVSLAS